MQASSLAFASGFCVLQCMHFAQGGHGHGREQGQGQGCLLFSPFAPSSVVSELGIAWKWGEVGYTA